MKLYFKKIVIASVVMGILPLLFIFTCFGASILDGYPITGTGLTSNTVMRINLDSPVAMSGNQPDMTYCVKKITFSGFDYVFTDVTCDVAAADDRLSVTLYPQALLDTDAQYAYRIENINFQGGGSDGHFSQCYATGNNPVVPPAKSVAEASLCTDYNYLYNGMSMGSHCYRCHVGGYTEGIIWPVDTFPIPTCTP